MGTAISEENHFNQVKVQYTINSSNIGYDMSDQPMLCIAKCSVSCRVVSCRAVSCHVMSCLDSATQVFSYLKQILLLSAHEIHDYTSLSNAWQNSRHIISVFIFETNIAFISTWNTWLHIAIKCVTKQSSYNRISHFRSSHHFWYRRLFWQLVQSRDMLIFICTTLLATIWFDSVTSVTACLISQNFRWPSVMLSITESPYLVIWI